MTAFHLAPAGPELLIWLAVGLFVVAILWAVVLEARDSRRRRRR